MNNTIAIILAAGDGKRFGGYKQFVEINNKPVLVYTLEKFKDFTKVVTVPDDCVERTVEICDKYKFNNLHIIPGGKYRQESVKKALKYIKKYFEAENVIITDANRPLITKATIDSGLKKLDYPEYLVDCVVTVCKPVNTSCSFKNGYMVYERDPMYELLMPQFFKFEILYEAHKKALLKNATDDSQLLVNRNITFLQISSYEGLKLTHFEDVIAIKCFLDLKSELREKKNER